MHSIGVNKDWTVKLEKNGTDVIYKMDSGAQVNAMPESIYKIDAQTEIRIQTKKSKTYYMHWKPNSGHVKVKSTTGVRTLI